MIMTKDDKLPTCPYCGSRQVIGNASISWDFTMLSWSIINVSDEFNCSNCEETFNNPNWIYPNT